MRKTELLKFARTVSRRDKCLSEGLTRARNSKLILSAVFWNYACFQLYAWLQPFIECRYSVWTGSTMYLNWSEIVIKMIIFFGKNNNWDNRWSMTLVFEHFCCGIRRRAGDVFWIGWLMQLNAFPYVPYVQRPKKIQFLCGYVPPSSTVPAIWILKVTIAVLG